MSGTSQFPHECTIDTIKLNPHNESYASEVHSSELRFLTRKLSLYVRLLVVYEFGTCVVLLLFMTGEILRILKQMYCALHEPIKDD